MSSEQAFYQSALKIRIPQRPLRLPLSLCLSVLPSLPSSLSPVVAHIPFFLPLSVSVCDFSLTPENPPHLSVAARLPADSWPGPPQTLDGALGPRGPRAGPRPKAVGLLWASQGRSLDVCFLLLKWTGADAVTLRTEVVGGRE